MQDAEWAHMRASNKIRFILAVIRGELVRMRRRALVGPWKDAANAVLFRCSSDGGAQTLDVWAAAPGTLAGRLHP